MTGKPYILWVPWKTLGSRFHLLKSPAACNGKLTSFLKVQGGNSAVILISLVNKLSEISLLIAIRALWWVKTPLCTHLYQIHEGIYIFHLKMDGLNYWIHGCKHYNSKLCSLPFKKKYMRIPFQWCPWSSIFYPLAKASQSFKKHEKALFIEELQK